MLLKFSINNYFIIPYIIALVLSIVRYRRYYESLLKYFPIIIGYTLLTEVLGILIKENDDLQIVYLDGYSFYNQLIFNIFDFIFFLYFYYVFWNAVSSLKSKSWIKKGAVLYIIHSLINPFFQDFMLYPQMLAFLIGSLVLIFCIVLYLRELKLKAVVPNYQNLLFWISLGLLVFYTFYPFILLVGYFDYELYQKLYFRQIHYALIVAMYSCFILGFLLMRRMRSYRL